MSKMGSQDEDSSHIFHSPSESSLVSDPKVLILHKDLIIDGVKFTPGHMLFENAYEGKCFKQRLIIQNCGPSLALIRLCQPNSAAIIYKPFEKGVYLSPGLKITRLVTFTYCSTLAVPGAFAPVHVNGHSFNYKFIVTMSTPVITLEPTHLDFGRIDAVNAATTRTLTIRNSGCKGTLFAVDLGRNKLDLIVDPMKGSAPAKSVVTLTVELVGSHAGAFAEEFWIKTTPPQRVVVEGTFIAPMLMVRKFITTLDFCLIDFNKVFVGSRSTKVLIIRNYSSSDSIFYVMAEIQGKAMSLDEARQIDSNYRNFFVNPEDGRMRAQKGSVVQITFAPEKYGPNERSYCACFLKVARMDCRDFNDEIVFHEQDIHDYRNIRSDSIIPSSENTRELEEQQSSHQIIFHHEPDDSALLSFETSIRVCIHAEKETASVKLRPDIIALQELVLGKAYERELRVENNSCCLPLTVKYKKMASVEVCPEMFHLNPSGSIEVKVLIRASAIANISGWICFELLATDLPYDQNHVKKVGSASVQLLVSTSQVARRQRLKKCCLENSSDLALKLKDDFPLKLSKDELKRKEANDDFYLSYIRSNIKKREYIKRRAVTALPDYEVTYKQHYLTPKGTCGPYLQKDVIPFEFIPLPPNLLYNIKITPKSFRMRRVAAFTVTTESFRIHNKNTFPVYIHLERSKSCITFPFNARHLIEADEVRDIPVNFSSSSNGRYHITIAVIVNNSNIFEVTAIADVVPKTLKVETTRIEFKENEINYKLFNLTNLLNSDTTFQWEIPIGAFEIYPVEGRVPAESFLTCMVSYNPNLSLPDTSECILTAESGQKMLMQFTCKTRNRSLAFSSYEIDFGEIPLNVETTRKCVMQNLKINRVIFEASFDPPLPGITVDCKEGVLYGKASQPFLISVHLYAVIKFNTKLKIRLDESENVEIAIKGTVDFPCIALSPDMLYFRKIAPYSFDCLVFKVKNSSQCEINITFPLEDFPEFSITEEEDNYSPHCSRFVLFPNEAKVLYLHFHPYYVSTYSFYLPIIINDILGPLIMNGGETNMTKYFLRDGEHLYENITEVTIPPMPSMLATVRVNCCAVNKSVMVSAYELYFTYYNDNHPANVTTQDITVTNTSEESIDICIRVDELEAPFYFEPIEEDDTDIVREDISFVIFRLEPEGKQMFRASFAPLALGTYSIKLPLFLHHYYDNKIFNYIRLHGAYLLPTITPSQSHIHFESTPVKIMTECKITLRMINHLPECTVSTQTDSPGLCAIFQDGRDPKHEDVHLSVLLSYTSIKAISFDEEIIFYCTCHASCKVYVAGAAEHCIFTSHPYFQFLNEQFGTEELISKNAVSREDDADLSSTSLVIPNWFENLVCHNETCFPFFPEDTDESDYATYMRDVLTSVEWWVFTQGFYSKRYYRIPEGFTDYCSSTETHKSQNRKNTTFNARKSKPKEDPPLVQLIMNLTSPQVKNCLLDEFYDPEFDHSPVEEMAHMLKIYSNCLAFLRNLDALLPHVKSKYLLNYDDYLLYLKVEPQDDPKMERKYYNLFTKQCWLDLILQTIKVLVLFRIEIEEYPVKEKLRKASSAVVENIVDLISDRIHITDETTGSINDEIEVLKYDSHELVLILWLEQCYAEERYDLWGDEAEPVKAIVLLTEALSDGLIFAAVTAHYCPYIKNHIRKMNGCPVHPEDIFHNACQLVIIWNMLHLSYDINPKKIANPNPVELLLLITYLYDVLPSCCPKEIVTIGAPLTQRATKKIDLQNLGFAPINYELVFFGNNQQLFSVPATSYRVGPHRKKTVEIAYHAKSVRTISATLLFSGETPGHRYGKSMAVNLMGVPDVTYACKEINVNVELYKLCEVTLNLESPFPTSAEYGLYVGVGANQGELYSWDDLKLLRTIKECLPESGPHIFDDEGKRSLKAQMCCLQQGPRTFWLYYTNSEVGDWSTRVTITGKVNKSHFEDVEVDLPKNFSKFTCCCKSGINFASRCPLNVKIQIPAKNNKLWDAMKMTMLRSVKGKELQFWKKRIFTATGTRIITLILNSETHPMRQSINTTVEYTVLTEKGCPFKTVQKIQIDDITSEDFVELPIHPHKGKKLENGAVITMRMISMDLTEKRFYNVRFHGENDPESASQIAISNNA